MKRNASGATKNKTAAIRLSDEEQVKDVLGEAILGLWDDAPRILIHETVSHNELDLVGPSFDHERSRDCGC